MFDLFKSLPKSCVLSLSCPKSNHTNVWIQEFKVSRPEFPMVMTLYTSYPGWNSFIHPQNEACKTKKTLEITRRHVTSNRAKIMKSSVNWQVPVEMVGRAMGGDTKAKWYQRDPRNTLRITFFKYRSVWWPKNIVEFVIGTHFQKSGPSGLLKAHDIQHASHPIIQHFLGTAETWKQAHLHNLIFHTCSKQVPLQGHILIAYQLLINLYWYSSVDKYQFIISNHCKATTI